MKQIAIGICSMTPLVASAQWNTNSWPAWQHPRKGVNHASECYSGIVERAAACGYGTNNVTLPVWYRTQKGNLSYLKVNMKDLLGRNWWAVSNAGGPDVAMAWLTTNATSGVASSNGDTAAVMPTLWTGGICSNLALPTNYFDYTPYRFLSGLGSSTNDINAVGHPHGFTNEYTAAGGTNTLPAGRTAWYTSDYGWDGLRSAIRILETTYRRHDAFYSFGEITAGSDGTNWFGQDSTHLPATNSGTWAAAKSAADTNNGYSQSGIVYLGGGLGSVGRVMHDGSFITYYAAATRSWTQLIIDQSSEALGLTNQSWSYAWAFNGADSYHYSSPVGSMGGANTEYVFDCPDYSTGWNAIDSSSATTNLTWTNIIGNTATGPTPTWCDEPTNFVGVAYTKYRGYLIDDFIALTKWTFLYK